MTTTSPRRSRLRFLRFGLRGLLGLVTLVALGLGAYRVLVVPHHKEQAFLAAAEKTNASVTIQRWWSGERVAWTSDLQVGLLDRIVVVDFSVPREFTPEATDEVVALLSGLVSLRELDLSRGHVSDTALESLALPELRKLTLRECRRVEVLRLSRMPRLEELDAGSSNLRALYCRGIPNLRSADLSRTRITHDTLAALADLPELRELDVSNTPLTGEALGLLPPSVEELRIDFTVLDEPGVAHLSRLPNLKHVGMAPARTAVERGQESRLRHALRADVKIGPSSSVAP